MKDQHTKIKGYRDLSQAEIDLMNKVKDHAEDTKTLIDEIAALREEEVSTGGVYTNNIKESFRDLEIAKEKLQTGYMWLVRSVALPSTF